MQVQTKTFKVVTINLEGEEQFPYWVGCMRYIVKSIEVFANGGAFALFGSVGDEPSVKLRPLSNDSWRQGFEFRDVEHVSGVTPQAKEAVLQAISDLNNPTD